MQGKTYILTSHLYLSLSVKESSQQQRQHGRHQNVGQACERDKETRYLHSRLCKPSQQSQHQQFKMAGWGAGLKVCLDITPGSLAGGREAKLDKADGVMRAKAERKATCSYFHHIDGWLPL